MNFFLLFFNFAAFWKISAWSWRVMSSAREILQNLNSAHKWKHYYEKFISLCVIELQLACIVSFKYIEVNLALVEKKFFADDVLSFRHVRANWKHERTIKHCKTADPCFVVPHDPEVVSLSLMSTVAKTRRGKWFTILVINTE